MADMGNIEYTVSVETGKAFRAADDFDQSLNRMEQSANRTDRTFGKMNTTLTQVAKSVAAIVSVGAVVNEFKKAVQVTADFNQTMSNLSSLTGLVGPQLDDLANKAKAIGSTTSLSATQAASAMQLIGSKAPELLATADGLTKVTEAAVVLAEAAGTDMTTAAGVLTSTMNQFNLVASDSDRIINTLAAGAALGASSVSETAAALARAGTQANESNVSIEQFTGAVQALAKGEIAASDAGTALRNTLLILDNQMNRNLKPSVVGLDSALENLKKEQKAGLDMLKLFGRENITAANVLLNNIDVYKSVTAAVTDTNAAYDQQAMRNDNLATDVKNLGSAYEGLQLTIGSMVDGELRSFTQALTSMLLALGDTSDGTSKLETILNALAVAGSATAAVIAGRVVSSIVAASAAQVKLTASTIAGISAQRAASEAAIRRTNEDKRVALQLVQNAAAEEKAARGTTAHEAALRKLTSARQHAISATTAHSAATQAATTNLNLATLAANGLRTAMSFLGGPVGILTIAASAIYFFYEKAKQAKQESLEYADSIKVLTGRLNTMTEAQLGAEKALTDRSIDALRGELKRLGDEYDSLSGHMKFITEQSIQSEAWDRRLIETKRDLALNIAEQEKVQKKLNQAVHNSAEISNAMDGNLRTEYVTRVDNNQALSTELALRQQINKVMGGRTDEGEKKEAPSLIVGDAPTAIKETTEEGQKLLNMYREQLELSKVTGAARARLAAIQRLGSEATEDERKEAADLAEQIYKNDQALKELSKTTGGLSEAQRKLNQERENEKEGIKQNEATLESLREEIEQLGMSSEKLMERQAELSLNEYATPEQIEQVKSLRAELAALQEQKQFDRELEQEAKELTGQADQEKYELELERYQEMLDRKLISDMEYEEAKAQLEQENDERIRAMEEERFRRQGAINDAFIGTLNNMGDVAANSMMGFITGTRSAEGAIKDLGRSIAAEFLGNLVKIGVQMAINAAKDKIFAAQSVGTAAATGAAITASMAPAAAAASVATLGGAAASGMTAMASAIPAMLAMFGGGRQYGGAVDADKVYRVNEGGRPEIFSGADGHQYMMPNQRGEVVSNKDASKGGGGVTVIVNESPNARASVEQSQGDDGDTIISITVQDITGGGPIRDAIGSTFGLEAQGT